MRVSSWPSLPLSGAIPKGPEPLADSLQFYLSFSCGRMVKVRQNACACHGLFNYHFHMFFAVVSNFILPSHARRLASHALLKLFQYYYCCAAINANPHSVGHAPFAKFFTVSAQQQRVLKSASEPGRQRSRVVLALYAFSQPFRTTRT